MLSALLAYDPEKRITAHQALLHPWWEEDPKVTKELVTFSQGPVKHNELIVLAGLSQRTSIL